MKKCKECKMTFEKLNAATTNIDFLSDDFQTFSYECMKCEDRYKTLSITNPEHDLETLFEIEKEQKLIKYRQEIK